MKMKLATITLSAALALEALSARAGDVNLLGNLTVTSNLTAQSSITLGGVQQTNWPSLAQGYQGYKYVIVAEGTNDVQRGGNLQAAYATATTLGPAATNRVVVLVPPGSYNLGSGLVMNTSYVDLIGLVPAQMTTKQVFTDSSGTIRTKTVALANPDCPVVISGVITQTTDNVQIESVLLNNSAGYTYWPTVAGTNTVLRHVSARTRGQFAYAGLYIDCVGAGTGYEDFGVNGTASGTFVDCVAGGNAFGAYGTASGTFINCSAGDNSFGNSITASGVFLNCVGGDDSFGGYGATASGTFKDCVGGDRSFGGGAGTASGTFKDCTGGDASFGGVDDGLNDGSGTASGIFVNCTGGDYSFGTGGVADGTFTSCTGGINSFGGMDADEDPGTLDSAAKLEHCQGGSGSFGSFNMASQDFSYNVGGANTFLMLPQLPTSTNGLPSGTVYNNGGTLKIVP